MKGDIVYAVALLLILLLPTISFAIDVSSCQNITSPGYYQLTTDLVGEPLNTSDVPAFGGGDSYACLRLNSSDITLDCNGHSLTSDNPSLFSQGIIADDSSGTVFNNITVENCPMISDYSDGIYIGGVENSTVTSNSVSAPSGYGYYGLYFDGSLTDVFNMTVTNNTAEGMNDGGFEFSGTVSYVNLTNNTAASNPAGNGFGLSLPINMTTNDSITNNIAIGNMNGFSVSGGASDFMGDNTAINNSNDGMDASAVNMTFVNNTAINSGGYDQYDVYYFGNGFTLSGDGFNATNNHDINGSQGFYISVSDSIIDNNTAIENINGGFNLEICYQSNFTNNSAFNDSGPGFAVFDDDESAYSGNNLIMNNNATSASEGFLLYFSDSDNFTGDNALNDSDDGFLMSDRGYGYPISYNDTFTGNNAGNNTNEGFLMDMSSGVFLNNTALNNSIGLSVTGTNNDIENNTLSENGIYDLWVGADSCANNITNNTGSGNRPILFSNQSVNWSSVTASEIILCHADDSTLNNVSADGSDTLSNNGIFLLDTYYADVENSSSNGNGYGIDLLSDTGINIKNDTFNGNQIDGISLQDSGGITIDNNTVQENGQYDVFVNESTPYNCWNFINNTIASGNKPIAYYDSPVSLSGDNSHAEIILCNASYSSINNAVVHGSNTINNDGMLIDQTDFSNITNSVSSGNYVGMSFMYSSNNNISGDTTDNNAADGILLYRSNQNILSGDTETGNGGLPIDIIDSFGNVFGPSIVLSECANITDSGYYYLTNDVTLDRSYYDDPTTCIDVNASNVVLDCTGHSIRQTGAQDSGVYSEAGILSNDITGLSVMNCNISGFPSGIEAYDTNYSSFENTNVSVANEYGSGILVEGDGSVLYNDIAYTIYESDGFDVQGGDALVGNNTVYGSGGFSTDFALNGNGDTIENNTADGGETGFNVFGNGESIINNSMFGAFFNDIDGADDIFDNNTIDHNAHGATMAGSGFDVSGNLLINNVYAGLNCSLYNSQVYDNRGSGNQFGIAMSGGNNGVTNNALDSNTEFGMYVTSETDSMFDNNNLTNNGWYDLFVDSDSCSNFYPFNRGTGHLPIVFTNTTVSWSSMSNFSEIILCDANNSVLNHITVGGNGNDGILLQGTSNATISSSVSSSNFNGVYIHLGGNNTVVNSIFDSDSNGISLSDTVSNLIVNDTSDNNKNGIMLTNTFGNTITGNAQENNQYDLFVHPGTDRTGSSCDNTISGLVGSGSKPILFRNSAITLTNNNSYSEILLCDADGSVLNNDIVSGSTSLNNGGIVLVNTDNSVISQSNSSNNYNGIYLLYSNGNNITGNILNGDVEGIRFEASDDNLIYNNAVRSSTDTGILSAGPNQLNYYPFAYSNLYSGDYPQASTASNDYVTGNTVSSSVNSGISLSNTYGCNISSNSVSNNGGAGIVAIGFQPSIYQVFNDTTFEYDLISANFTYISHNTVTNNGLDGIDFNAQDGSCYDAYGDYCSDSNISYNVVNHNNYGIYQSDASQNNYSLNLVTSNRYDGIRIDAGGHGNQLVLNTVSGNSWDGIVLTSNTRLNYLANNTALSNSNGFVIYSEAYDNILVNNTGAYNSQNGFKMDQYSDNNNLSYNNGSYNSNDGFGIFGGSSGNIIDHDQASYDRNNGYELINAGNSNTVSNSNATNCSSNGIWLWETENANIINNNATRNPIGIGMYGSGLNVIANNYVFNSTGQYGVYLTHSDNNSLFNNTALKSRLGSGFYVDNSNNEILVGNNASNNAFGYDENGFFLSSNNSILLNNSGYLDGSTEYDIIGDNNTLIGNNATSVIVISDTSGGYGIEGDLNVVDNNTATDVQVGFDLAGSNNTFTNNNAYGNLSIDEPAYSGYELESGSYNIFANDTAWGFKSGFNLYAFSSPITYNNFTGNSVTSATDVAYTCGYPATVDAEYNYFSNNTASSVAVGFIDSSNNFFYYNNVSNATEGFDLNTNDTVIGNILTNCTYGIFTSYGGGVMAANNTMFNDSYGIYLSSSYVFNDSDFINNSVFNNTYGVFLGTNTWDINFSQNTFDNNLRYGVSINQSYNDTMAGDHYFNNTYDLRAVNCSGLNLTDAVFDSPQGDYQNYTNLSLLQGENDTGFFINWTANESVPPLPSFRQKFVNISSIALPVTIHSVVWSWLDSELPGYNESMFELWGYDQGGWHLLNDTPDIAGNTLSFTNLNPESDYGILQGILPEAPDIAFVPPTPDNATTTIDSSILVNITINETAYPLGKFIFDWNGSSAPRLAAVNLTQSGGEGDTLTLYCPAGSAISSYSSRWGYGCSGCDGGAGVPCGSCNPGDASCSITYGVSYCGGDCNVGCTKPSQLNMTCTGLTLNDTFYGTDLVAMYNFDNFSIIPSSNTVADKSGNGHDATCPLGRCPAWISGGVYGGAYSFDGVNDYFDTNTNFGNYPLTFSAWIQRASLTGGTQVLFASEGMNGWGVFVADDGEVHFTDVLVNNVASTGTITDTTTWHLVTVTYDGSDVDFYIDGVPSGSVPYTDSFGSTTSYTLGGWSTFELFNGSIDDVRVYDTALSPGNVSDIFNANPPSSGLVAHYDFDNSTAVSLNGTKDVSLYSNDATCTDPNCPTWTSDGKYGGAYSFDGSSEYYSSSNNVGITSSSPRTLALWVKTTGTTRQSMAGWGGVGVGNAFNIEHSVAGWCPVGDLYLDGYFSDLCSSFRVNDGLWHYVVAEYNGTDEIPVWRWRLPRIYAIRAHDLGFPIIHRAAVISGWVRLPLLRRFNRRAPRLQSLTPAIGDQAALYLQSR